MKKRHSIQILLAVAAIFFAATACTQDELTDDTRLPEGQYPLQIAAVTLSVEGGEAQPWGAPQTRVSENGNGNSSKFDADDKFYVQIEGSTETATYIVQAGGTVTSNAPLYWSDRDDHTVTAWYPATDEPLNLSDQTDGLAYLLHGKGRGNYEKPVELIFTHSLAKVRVTPSNDIADDEVTSLKLYTYTQCTHNQGNDVQGTQEGWIEMMPCTYTDNGTTITCWEANVVPGYAITKLRANDTDERNLSAAINPVAGSFYNIRLNKDKGYTVSEDGKTYTVTSADGLLAWNEAVQKDMTLNCTLADNIDLTGIDWTPIGKDDNKAYTGTFDGNGKTITGLTVTGSNDYAGLFGYIGSGGMVKNVVLEDVQITSDNSSGYAGGVAGYCYRGTLENCSVSGSVSGSGSSSDVGGVVGYQLVGSITGCSSSATVKGMNRAGGVVGVTNNGATLTACYATGDVTVENDGTSYACAGGIVGMNGGNSTLTACYAAGNVSGKGSGTIHVGGAVGENYGTLTACYWSGLPDNDNGGSTKVDGTTVTWQTAVDAMNEKLSGTGWRYVTGSGDAPLTLRKQ